MPEFTEREQQGAPVGLGELPAQTVGAPVPGGVETRQPSISAPQDSIGGEKMTYPVSVTSVYPAQPINSKHFVWDSGPVYAISDYALDAPVPQGYVAVIRSVKWQFCGLPGITHYTIPALPAGGAYYIDLYVDGMVPLELSQDSGVVGASPSFLHHNLIGMGGKRDLYLIVDQNSKLKVVPPALDTSYNLGVTFEGEYLLKKAVAANFQPGNVSGSLIK
jgi:hypothetical protein